VYQTFEATIDASGNIQLKESVRLPEGRRALVVVLEDVAAPAFNETAILSEASLAVDWNRPEEDAAWAYLQSGK
jgi:hypothetical protein